MMTKEEQKAGARPPMRNRTMPMRLRSFLLITCMSLPTMSVTGMMTMHGMLMRFCTSVWLRSGKWAPMTLRELAIPTTPIMSMAIV